MNVNCIKIVVFLFICLNYSCIKKDKNTHETDFDSVFNTIKTKSIQEVDWSAIHKKTKDSIRVFNSIYDKYRAIAYTLDQLDDRHSFFLYPEDEKVFSKLDTTDIPEVCHYLIDQNIAYVKIEGFGGDKNLNDEYILSIRKALYDLDRQKEVSGWIIDLRDNFGGKLGGFSVGLSPLYKDSILGFSMNNKKEFIEHKLKNNTYHYGDTKLVNPLINSKDT